MCLEKLPEAFTVEWCAPFALLILPSAVGMVPLNLRVRNTLGETENSLHTRPGL